MIRAGQHQGRLKQKLNPHINTCMSDIRVVKADEATAVVHCDPGIAYELSENFKFRVPGYQFMPSYKDRIWDGYIRLFNTKNHRLPLGLVPKLLDDIDDCYSTEIDEALIPEPFIEPTDLNAFIDTLPLTADGEKITPFWYQRDSVEHICSEQRCLLLSPTSSGKSLIFYLATRAMLHFKHTQKTLIIVPTVDLVEQMVNDFKDYSTTDEWDAEAECHRVYSGKDKTTTKPIVVSTWQSLYRLPKQFFEQFDSVIVDEAHLAKGDSLQKIMNKLVNAKVRVGATGTLDGERVHELVLIGSFGPVHKIVTTKQLIDEDVITNVQIRCIRLIYPEADRKQASKEKTYQAEVKQLIAHPKRNRFIARLAASRNENTLILVSRVATHGKPLYNALCKIKDKQVFIVDKDTPPEQVLHIKQLCKTHDNVIVIATYQKFSTGISIKNLHHIIFAIPAKGRIRVSQSIGRMLRKHHSKTTAYLYDICDDLRRYSKLNQVTRVNHTFKHFLRRVKIYDEEQFNYSVSDVPVR